VTPTVPVRRRALSVVTLAVALTAAVVVQVTVVNRLPLPGAAAPDLVVLLVTAIAVVTTPDVAAVTGFAGGLALDVAPPAAHYAGQNALVFCLAGYAASRIYRAMTATTGDHDHVAAFTVMAAATAAGEAGKAALGMLLSDPHMTTADVSHVLPGAILYDLLLSPLVFLLVAWVTRGTVPGRVPARRFSREVRPDSVIRPASAGATPNVRLAGTGMSFKARALPRRVPGLRLSGTGKDYSSPSVAGRVPNLRLSGTTSPALTATAATFSGRSRSLNFAGDLPVRNGARAARTPGKNWLRSTVSPSLPAAQRPAHVPSPGWLGPGGARGLAASRGGSSAGMPQSRLAGVRIGRRMGDVINGHAASGLTRRRRKAAYPRRFASGTLGAARPSASLAPLVPRTAAEALAARSAPSGVSALSGAGTPLAGGPHAGWLRGSRSATTAAVRKAPRSGWLGRSRPRTVIGSVVGGRTAIGPGLGGAGRRRPRRQATDGGNWYTASPSGTWLRRGRHPWRTGSQRLLRLVGVLR